jgi:hypothetical protein
MQAASAKVAALIVISLSFLQVGWMLSLDKFKPSPAAKLFHLEVLAKQFPAPL